MKTKLILLFFLFCLTANAQSYKPVITDSITKWSIVVLPDYHASEEWIVTGDTIFDKIKYKVVSLFVSSLHYYNYTLSDSLWQVNPPEYLSRNYRFVRETEDASKLFLYDNKIKKEYLISDLNLQKGDTFYLPSNSQYFFFNANYNKNYSIVDSVFIKDGLKHVELNSRQAYFELKLNFVEETGPNLGIFYMYGGEGLNQTVFCLNCFQNKNIFYKQSLKWNFPCSFNWINAVPTVKYEEYKLIQTNEMITLQFKTFNNRLVYLYDLTGRKLLTINSQNANNVRFYTSVFENGCYVLHILNINEQKRMNEKIIIN